MRRGPHARTAGFTLMEMVMVVVVSAVLAGVAVPSLNGLTASQSNVAAARIRTALIYAQEWAMDSGNHTWVAFDANTELVSVYVENPASPGLANRVALTDPLKRGAMTLQLGDAGIGIVTATFAATSEVEFDSLGIPYDRNGGLLATDGTVVVTGGVTVRVTKNTGLVTVD
jgi:prepilin-type N-terminal cleavage/methylation domain-containing protein